MKSFVRIALLFCLFGCSLVMLSAHETGVVDQAHLDLHHRELAEKQNRDDKQDAAIQRLQDEIDALKQTQKAQQVSTLRLASWNIRIFSDGSRDDDELDYIAKVLIEYDFIAIVELRDEKVLKRTEAMLQDMGRDYDYLVSSPVGRGVKERYAFLFDPQMVNVIEDGEVFPDPNDAFIREPYFATFKAGEFDFTVIAVHIIWGDSVAQRRGELKELANVYQQIQADDDAEQDVILVGDFNRNPGNRSGYGPLLSIPSMGHLFKPPQKSHIKDTSLYDNIFFQMDYVSEYTGESGIDRFDEIHFGNDDTQALKAVSDHRPVWGIFHTHTDDD